MENIQELQIILRIGIATFLGLCIGIERQRNGKIAGIRTFSSMALGTALLAVFGLHFFPSELSVYVVSATIIGIALLSSKMKVFDTDNNQDFSNIVALWTTGAISLACAYGLFITSAGTAFLLIFIYLFKDIFEKK